LIGAKPAHDIFISHSSKDKTIADAVCATFEASGIRCWVAPRDVPPGAAWGGAIVDAIEQSRVMVLIFSDNANASGQIAREVECAASHGVTIVPIRMEDVAPAGTLQYFLSNIHWLDALSPPLERRLQEIAAKIKPMLGHNAAITPPVLAPQLHAKAIPSNKRWRAGVAALLVLLAGAAMIWRPWAHPTTRVDSPRRRRQFPAQIMVDPALVGRWSYVTTLLDAEVHVELAIDAGGRYTFRVYLKGEGTVQPRDGKAIVTDKRNGANVTATYAFPSEDRLNWTTPTADPNVRMTLNYKRAGGKKMPENPLVGRWRATTLFAGLMWDADWDVQPDSSFQFLFENVDEGTLTAAQGEWESKSKIGRPAGKGIYRNVTPDSFEMSHPVLQMLRFERAGPHDGR